MGEEWSTAKEHANTIEAAFKVYLEERTSLSQSLNYWNTYVSDLFPIIRDLTNSLRAGDWILYLSAVERATSLFFFFWENKLLPMDTIIPAGLLSTEGEVATALRLLHEGWIHREHYDSYMKGGFIVNTTTLT